MSGKHVKRVAWRPRRLAPVLTLLAGFGTWAALAAALVLLPSTTPADVHGALSRPAPERGDRGPVTLPRETLRTEPAEDASPTAGRDGVSRDARRTAEPDAASTVVPTSEPTSEPTTDPTTTTPGPAHTSPPGQANGHDDDNPGKGHGPHGKP